MHVRFLKTAKISKPCLFDNRTLEMDVGKQTLELFCRVGVVLVLVWMVFLESKMHQPLHSSDKGMWRSGAWYSP
jgi:hypothetical protein